MTYNIKDKPPTPLEKIEAGLLHAEELIELKKSTMLLYQLLSEDAKQGIVSVSSQIKWVEASDCSADRIDFSKKEISLIMYTKSIILNWDDGDKKLKINQFSDAAKIINKVFLMKNINEE